MTKHDPTSISMKALIRRISDELLESQRERQLQGLPAVFEVQGLDIEVSFVVTESRQGGGGFDLRVIKADGSMKYEDQSVQKVTLHLGVPSARPVVTRPDVDDDPLVFDDELPVRPRLRRPT